MLAFPNTIENIMKYPKVLPFALLISTAGTVSAIQASNLLTNPSPSAPPPSIASVAGWRYVGCWSDRENDRTLIGAKWTGVLTPGRCAMICKGYRYFALESGFVLPWSTVSLSLQIGSPKTLSRDSRAPPYEANRKVLTQGNTTVISEFFPVGTVICASRLIGSRCYCGNTVAHESFRMADHVCANVCSGTQQSVCGGHYALSLYAADKFAMTASLTTILVSSNATTNLSSPNPTKTPSPPPAPVVLRVPGWKYRGCYTDNPSDRTLTSKSWRGYITPKTCADICKGYRYFGLEYSVRNFGVRVSSVERDVESRDMSWECSHSRCVSKLVIPFKEARLTPKS